MEFEMKRKLRTSRGHEVIILVDAAGDDCVISLTTPHSFGVDLATVIAQLWIELAEIEEAAWESYQERLRESREAED